MKTATIFRFLIFSLMLAGVVVASHAQGVSKKRTHHLLQFQQGYTQEG